MHSQLVIAALAASASASVNLFPGHGAIRRDLLAARQTETPSATSGGLSDTECQATLLAITTELPMPEGDLLEWEQLQSGTNPCSVTEVPSSLSSQYTSYIDAVLSWYSASSSELLDAISACPQYAAAVSEVQVCTSSLSAETTGSGSASGATATESDGEASATGSSTGTATESGSSDSTGTASASASSSAETAGAPIREAGIVGAVLAGVLGVAVAL